MKKFICSSVVATAVLFGFMACEKQDVKQKTTAGVTGKGSEKTVVVCPIPDIYETSYFSLGVTLFGPGAGGAAGEGTSGVIDKRLNCSRVEGPLCNIVENTIQYGNIGPSTVLNDGVMTTAEQQSLVNSIQSGCTSHMLSTYGSTYSIIEYDCYFWTALCGGCDGILVFVKYKAGKRCRN